MEKYLLAALALCYVACAAPEAAHDHDGEDPSHAHTATQEQQAHLEEQDHDHSGEEAHVHPGEEAPSDEHTDEIVFTARQAAMGEFELDTAARSTFAPVIPVSGQIVSSAADFRTVVAPSAGEVLPEANITPGARVEAGTPLARIVSKNMADGDTYARVKAQYDYAAAQWERAERLIGDRIITRSEYLQAKLDYENARQAYQALSGSENGGIVVRAPFAGYVRSLEVVPGAFADKGAALFTLVRSSRGRLQADVPQKYYGRLPEVVSAVFVAEDGAKYDTDSLNGRVVSYSRAVSPSGLLTLTLEYDAVPQIPQGAFVQVYLRLKDRRDALTVPLSALTEEQGSYFVYVQPHEEAYEKRLVTVGQHDGLRAEILSGLHEGEVFVSRGAYRVKVASASGAIPHGHEH